MAWFGGIEGPIILLRIVFPISLFGLLMARFSPYVIGLYFSYFGSLELVRTPNQLLFSPDRSHFGPFCVKGRGF